jgi:hypothetical protein
LHSSDQLPSGPHRSACGGPIFHRIELRALPASEGESTCTVSYTFKWLWSFFQTTGRGAALHQGSAPRPVAPPSQQERRRM